MIADTITMTAMGGAVLALVEWLSIMLIADDQPMTLCTGSDNNQNE